MSKTLVTIKMRAWFSLSHRSKQSHGNKESILEMKGSTIANQFVAFLIVH